MVFGTTAVNSIAFALGVLQASSTEQTAGKVAGIAIAVNTFSLSIAEHVEEMGHPPQQLPRPGEAGHARRDGYSWLHLAGWERTSRSRRQTSIRVTAFDTTKSPSGVYRYAEAAVFDLPIRRLPPGQLRALNYLAKRPS